MNALSFVEQFEIDSYCFRLTRIDDELYYLFSQSSLHIDEDLYFFMLLDRCSREDNTHINFAQMYLSLKLLTGESGKSFDDWKGSFGFPFLLEVSKGDQSYKYTLNITNIRSDVYFTLRKVLIGDADKYDRMRIYPPFENEFPRADINQFIGHLYGYLGGYLKSQVPHIKIAKFFRRVDSNLILFGYNEGEFFQKHFEEYQQYEDAISEFEKQGLSEKLSLPALL